MSKESSAASKIKAALNTIPSFGDKVRILSDALKHIGLPMFGVQLREAIRDMDRGR